MSKNLFVKERSSERKKAVKVGQYQRITAQDCSILNGNAIHKKIDVKVWYFLQKKKHAERAVGVENLKVIFSEKENIDPALSSITKIH